MALKQGGRFGAGRGLFLLRVVLAPVLVAQGRIAKVERWPGDDSVTHQSAASQPYII